MNSFSDQLNSHSKQCTTACSACPCRLVSDICSELRSDFIPKVSKDTMQAVAASTASCPLASVGHFPGLFYFGKDKNWLLTIPGEKEQMSIACVYVSGISFNGKIHL